MKKYNSFIELTEVFAGREGTALEYLAEDGKIASVSYKELAERIKERAVYYSTKGPGTDYVYAKPDPEAVVEIFAAVYAKRCIIMADPMMPEKVLSEAVAGADKFVINMTEKRGDGEMLFFTSGTTSRSKALRLTSK